MNRIIHSIATIDDFKNLALLVNEFDTHLSIEHDKPTITSQELVRSRRYLKKYLQDKNAAYLIVLIDNNIIAYIFLCKDRKDHTLGFIHELFVVPLYRKKGIAKQLIQKSIEWFKSNNVETIQLTVNRLNENAVQLYKAANFEVYNDNYIDMRLKLKSGNFT